VTSDRSCFCNECFYCFMLTDTDTNLAKLSAIELKINVAEHVPTESAVTKYKNKHPRLAEIPIQICTSGYSE